MALVTSIFNALTDSLNKKLRPVSFSLTADLVALQAVRFVPGADVNDQTAINANKFLALYVQHFNYYLNITFIKVEYFRVTIKHIRGYFRISFIIKKVYNPLL